MLGNEQFYIYLANDSERFGNFVVTELKLRLLVFDPLKEKIIRWIS